MDMAFQSMNKPTALLTLLAALMAMSPTPSAAGGRSPKLVTRWVFRIGAGNAWQPIAGDTAVTVPVALPGGTPWTCNRQRVATSADGMYASGSIICAYGDAMAIASAQCAVGTMSADTSTVGIATMKGAVPVLLNVQCETRLPR
jgi:hypothetical protein